MHIECFVEIGSMKKVACNYDKKNPPIRKLEFSRTEDILHDPKHNPGDKQIKQAQMIPNMSQGFYILHSD